jgi:hypothetical protein
MSILKDKKKYYKPSIEVYGDIKEITKGGAGDDHDMGGSHDDG